TLEQLLQETATGSLPVQEMLRYALQLCGVLSYLHQQTPPIIFRDLKPSNVMVTAKGSIYLIDFGIARVFKHGMASDTHHLGTPGFASPEQHGNRQTGPRSDLYSLGATLHSCLTGKEPRTNTPTRFDFLPAHDLNAQVPLSLSQLIECLVATNEDQRPSSAEVVHSELLSIYPLNSNTVTKDKSTHDILIEYIARFSSRMVHHIKQLGLLSTRLTSPAVYLLTNVHSLFCIFYAFCVCCMMRMLSRLNQFSYNGICTRAAWVIELWQSLSTAEARLLLREVWTPQFRFRFVLFAIAMTGGSMFMLIMLDYPVYIVAFYLYLLLLLQIGIAYKKLHIPHPLVLNILKAMTFFLLLTGLALFVHPDVQSVIQASALAPIMHINQLAAYGLTLMAGVLACRWRRPFRGFDQFSLVCVAAVCAFQQSAAWNMNSAFTSLPIPSQSSQTVAIDQSQLVMLAITKLLTQAFILIVLIGLVIASSSVFVSLAKEFAWIDRQITKITQRFTCLEKLALQINHLILLATSITCSFLFWLGESGRLQFTSTLIFETVSQLITFALSLCSAGVLLLIMLLLVICSIVALVRLPRPFSHIDRWLILVNVIVSALLLFSGYTQQTAMQDHSQITSVRPRLTDPHIAHPSQAVVFGLLLATLISLLWGKRMIPQTYRNMLKVGFGLAVVCAALQWFTPVFLLAGLIMLTLSILLAVQVEQVTICRSDERVLE
ncbi:MAG TPA: serine/threonine-protein kinase, partial [Ktedonobacteraceae bacterium]|nr:serine/threonine-protein kinase [Ktedonobacteraceae bacterium]